MKLKQGNRKRYTLQLVLSPCESLRVCALLATCYVVHFGQTLRHPQNRKNVTLLYWRLSSGDERATATINVHRKFHEVWSLDMQADRQTYRHSLQYVAPLLGQSS